MNCLKASVAAVLAMSASLACAQGTSGSIEERLQRLEAEQSAMKQQLAERDAMIQELKLELQAQGAAAQVAAPAESAAAGKAAEVPVASAAPPAAGDATNRETTPRQVETWGVYDPGKGFLVGRSELGELGISDVA
jgi:peptidoglycan hydrolase CwlO-like protein